MIGQVIVMQRIAVQTPVQATSGTVSNNIAVYWHPVPA